MEEKSKIYSQPELDNSVKISEDELKKKIKIISNKAEELQDDEREILLRKAIGHIDLTSLNLNDTTETIEKLCLKVKNNYK